MGKEVMKSPSEGLLEEVFPEGEITSKPTKPQQLGMVIAKMLDFRDYLYVTEIDAIYCKEKEEALYRSLSQRELTDNIRESMNEFGMFFSVKDFTDTINLMKIHIPAIESLNTDCVMVSNRLFWDRVNGEVIDYPTAPVFYRLFDTSTETKHVVKIPQFNEEQEKIFWERYEGVKDELGKGKEIERYKFLKTWAAGSHDVYMDLHRAHAYMFLQKKPLGSYILIGIKRNGKSSYLGLTHSIMGGNNTSNVQLTQLGDPHYTHMLRTCLLNAPDEEDDKAVTAQAFFKIMADHGSLSLPVMRSNVPVQLNCDFMCFFPMNHTPEWKGSGAAACMDRSLIIPFNADLSKYDSVSGNFAKDTFTAETMADYMGSVFAYAWWFHRHDFKFSSTMRTEQAALEQDIDSCITYYKRFTKYFDGYENFKTVYDDYQFWCKTQDVKINSRKELKFVFRNMANSRISFYYKRQNTKVYRIPQPNMQPLMNDTHCSEVKPLEDLHEIHCSIIDQLDFYYEQKEEEWT